jgi:hypothetical protein
MSILINNELSFAVRSDTQTTSEEPHFNSLTEAYKVLERETEYEIPKYSIDSLVVTGSAAYATIAQENQTSHGALFGIIGRIKGKPKLTGYGTYGEMMYNNMDTVAEKAKVRCQDDEKTEPDRYSGK